MQSQTIDNGAGKTSIPGRTIRTLREEEIAILAHGLWIQRGSPEGRPREDSFEAARQLKSFDREHPMAA
jgi:Protein of unknown function (DUF2934)